MDFLVTQLYIFFVSCGNFSKSLSLWFCYAIQIQSFYGMEKKVEISHLQCSASQKSKMQKCVENGGQRVNTGSGMNRDCIDGAETCSEDI